MTDPDRRSFFKSVGAAILAPLALKMGETSPHFSRFAAPLRYMSGNRSQSYNMVHRSSGFETNTIVSQEMGELVVGNVETIPDIHPYISPALQANVVRGVEIQYRDIASISGTIGYY